MTIRKPPDSSGRGVGFPYADLWEGLEPNWEDSALEPGALRMIQSELELVRLLGGPAHLCITLEQIDALLHPLELKQETQEQLALHLYSLAGTFLKPEISSFWNASLNDARKQLEGLGDAAEAMTNAISDLGPDAELILQLFRKDPPDKSWLGPRFDRAEMQTKLRALAITARQILFDMPTKKRGGNIKFGLDRWIWCATRAMEHWIENGVLALQTDSTGRRPRLRGREGEVLLSYLRFVSPKIRIGTIIRVITDRRRDLRKKPAL